jgi:hypothetical protein
VLHRDHHSIVLLTNTLSLPDRRAIIWQDTFLSLCYDRPCGIIIHNIGYPSSTGASFEGYSFLDSCHHLFLTANKVCHAFDNARQSGNNVSVSSLASFQSQIRLIESEALSRLRDISQCKISRHYVELFCFRIYSDFLLFSLCRPTLTQLCFDRCHSVVTNYLRLRRLSLVTSQLWVLVHITLSCALTLATKLEDDGSSPYKALLRQLVQTFTRTSTQTQRQAYSDTLKVLTAVVDNLNTNDVRSADPENMSEAPDSSLLFF